MAMHYWHGNAKTSRTGLCPRSIRSHCHLELSDPLRSGAPGRAGAAVMGMRVFGRTGMRLSVLGFGCGAVGGLMVRGDWRDQERTVAGRSELLRHCGAVWRWRIGEKSRLCPAVVGTKRRQSGVGHHRDISRVHYERPLTIRWRRPGTSRRRDQP